MEIDSHQVHCPCLLYLTKNEIDQHLMNIMNSWNMCIALFVDVLDHGPLLLWKVTVAL